MPTYSGSNDTWRGSFHERTMNSRHAAQDSIGAAAHPSTREVLLYQLIDALRRRHWRIAIRRYFLLQAYGFDIPPGQEDDLKALIRTCPERDLERIRLQVDSWRDMQAVQRHTSVRPGIPVDRFEHLHAVFRRGVQPGAG
jgi:hypothetical protein